MATYNDIYNLRYSSSDLMNRTTVAVAKAAQDVLSEAQNTPNHAARLDWARAALDDARRMADRMLWGVLANGAIQNSGEASSDSDIQFTVNSLIDTYASEV